MAGRRLRPDATTVVALATFVVALVVYRATMLPGVGAWDTAEAQTVPPILGTMHPTGFPAYVVLGWIATRLLAPVGDPALRMNLLSGLLVASSAGIGVYVFRRLDAPPILAGAAALAFALTPITWSMGLSADAHALHLVLLAAITLCLMRWEAAVGDARANPDDASLRRRADLRLVAAAALYGVAVANHALSLLLAPAIGLFVLAVEWRVLRRPAVVLAALGALLGVAALLYLELPLRAGPFRAPLVYGSPGTWQGFWDVVLARQFQGDIIGGDALSKATALLDLARAQLGPLAILLPVAFGVTAWRHPRYALYSAAAVVVTCVFASTYSNAKIERYYLGPLFFAWSWLAGLGGAIAERLLAADDRDEQPDDGASRAEQQGGGPWDPVRAGVAVALSLALLVPTAIALRDRWSAVDQSGTTWAASWLDQAFTAIEPNGVVVSWWSYSTPLWYGTLVEGRRPDITVIDDRTRLDEGLGSVEDVVEANIDTRPVYVIRLQDSEVQALRDRYTIEPVGQPGNLYHVTGRTESTR